MDTITLNAEAREAGKKTTRAARRNGEVPCVLYASSVDPVIFTVTEKSLKPLIYTNETHRVSIEIGDDAWECILKDMDFHPVTDRPIHADFQVLQEGELLTLTVPVTYTGTPIGKADGGVVTYLINELDVRCLPKDIPSHIELDVSALHIGDALHVSDLDMEGIEFIASDEQTLVAVIQPRAEEEPEVDEDVALGTLEGEEGEEVEGEEEADEDQE